MVNIKGFIQLPDEQRNFICDYLDMLNSFRFNIKTYGGKNDDLPIQNTDLWIEAYIDIVPELQEFRDMVLSEMENLLIKKHPYYVYQKEHNHWYYSNKGAIEKLRESVLKENIPVEKNNKL